MTDVSTITVRRQDPAGDEDVVVVRGFRALKVALNDWRTFSSNAHGFLVLTPQDKTRTFRQYPFEFDPPEHTALRAIIEPFYKRPLTPEYAARMQHHIRNAMSALQCSERPAGSSARGCHSRVLAAATVQGADCPAGHA